MRYTSKNTVARRRLCEQLVRWRGDKDGATAVEFAFVAFPFFVMLAGLIEVACIFIVSTVLEHGAAEAARNIRTGEFQSGTATLDQFETDICNSMANLFDCKNKISIDVRSDFASFAATDDPSPLDNDDKFDDSSFEFEAGGRNDIVVVRVFYQWSLFTPVITGPLSNMHGNKRLIQSTVAFKNEPF